LYDHITLSPVASTASPAVLALPSSLQVESEEETSEDDVKMEEDEEEVFVSPEQISLDLITLANLPGSRWLNLLNLDAIKAKNKPKAPPKKPKAAPFFLPTIPGLETKFDLTKLPNDEDSTSKSFGLGFTSFTEFGSALGQAVTDEDFSAMVTVLLEKGPSALDLEVRALGPEGGGTIGLLGQFIRMVASGLGSNMNFEVLEAWLGLFLRVHGEIVASEGELVKMLGDLQTRREGKWEKLSGEMDSCLCMVTFFKSSFL